MIVPTAVDLKYRQARPIVLEIGERVRSIITRHLEGTGYAFVGRQKAAESLAEKIETGRYQSWSELDDLYGCTIVVPTSAKEPQVLEFLRGAFREIDVRRRGNSLKDPNVFRFDSTRFIGTILPTLSPEPPDALSRQRFEVQVRTAFEHAWAVATHSLVYKGERIDWRRFRLLAQLKAATEQMDSLINGFDMVAGLISEESWPEVTCKRMIEQALRARFVAGDIPAECEPASWVRFCENVYALVKSGAGGHRNLRVETMGRAIACIDRAIDTNRGEAFPRSVSLVQFILGALASEGMIENSMKDYCPMITSQLRSLFPAVTNINWNFDFELPGV